MIAIYADRIEVNGQIVPLGPTGWAVISTLASTPGKRYRWQDLSAVIGPGTTEAAVKAAVYRARRQLVKAGLSPLVVHSVYGYGYAWTAPRPTVEDFAAAAERGIYFMEGVGR